MNNTFNLKRFGMLFKKHTIEHGKANLLSIGVLTGILFIILGFAAVLDRHLSEEGQTIMFSIALIITGCIYTSMIFINLSDKRKAIPELTLPVSHFEKYLVAWLYSFPIFLATYLLVFYVTDGLVLSFIPPRANLQKDSLINVFDVGKTALAALFSFGVLHGLMFWGAIFFKKLHFIKTAFVFFIGFMLLIVVNKMTLAAIIPDGRFSNSMPYSWVHFYDAQNKFVAIGVSDDINILSGLILVTIVLLLWTSAFFRLKEKEV